VQFYRWHGSGKIVLTLYNPVVVTICTASLTFTMPRSAHTVCFLWISEQTAIISLYNILTVITKTECAYCAVRTECLYMTRVILVFKSHVTFPLFQFQSEIRIVGPFFFSSHHFFPLWRPVFHATLRRTSLGSLRTL